MTIFIFQLWHSTKYQWITDGNKCYKNRKRLLTALYLQCAVLLIQRISSQVHHTRSSGGDPEKTDESNCMEEPQQKQQRSYFSQDSKVVGNNIYVVRIVFKFYICTCSFCLDYVYLCIFVYIYTEYTAYVYMYLSINLFY